MHAELQTSRASEPVTLLRSLPCPLIQINFALLGSYFFERLRHRSSLSRSDGLPLLVSNCYLR